MSLYLCGQAVAGLAAEVGLDARGDAVDGEAGFLQQLRAAAVIEKDVGQAELDAGGGRAAGRASCTMQPNARIATRRPVRNTAALPTGSEVSVFWMDTPGPPPRG